jgi:hypothetical protein
MGGPSLSCIRRHRIMITAFGATSSVANRQFPWGSTTVMSSVNSGGVPLIPTSSYRILPSLSDEPVQDDEEESCDALAKPSLCTHRYHHLLYVIPCPGRSFGSVYGKEDFAPLRASTVRHSAQNGQCMVIALLLRADSGNEIPASPASTWGRGKEESSRSQCIHNGDTAVHEPFLTEDPSAAEVQYRR